MVYTQLKPAGSTFERFVGETSGEFGPRPDALECPSPHSKDTDYSLSRVQEACASSPAFPSPGTLTPQQKLGRSSVPQGPWVSTQRAFISIL